MRRYEAQAVKVTSYKRGGYYILRISNYTTHIAATRIHGEYAIEEWWSSPYEKKFEQMGQANKYFLAMKRNNPDLQLVSDEPNKYISYDGKVKEY